MRTFRDTAGGDRSDGGGAAIGAPGKRTLVEQEVIVTASTLRVRSAPDTSSKVLGKLHDGDRVQATGNDGAWLTTPYAGAVGYISGKYTKPATILDDVEDWITLFLGGGDHDDDPAAPAAPSVDPAKPAAPDGPEPSGPKPPPAPGDAKLSDDTLAAYLAGLGDPTADAAARAVASCEQQSAALAGKRKENEEAGAGRDTLVAAIGAARAQIALLDGAGLDPVSLGYVKPALHAILARCAPYYGQVRNLDLLETAGDTRTCNLTTLAMVLEGLGKTASDYAGSPAKVLAVARYYAPRIDAKVAGASASFAKLATLRLPDFLQVAAIAECMSGGMSDEEVYAAMVTAWKAIVKTFDIHIHLAKHFGVTGKVQSLEDGLGKGLGSVKKSARKDMQVVVDARNHAEHTGDADDQARYEAARDARASALSGAAIESKVPLEAYRATVLEHVGAELASGAGVFMLMAHHYARVQSVSEDHIVVDDPGTASRSGQTVRWEEARAMGYFHKRIAFH